MISLSEQASGIHRLLETYIDKLFNKKTDIKANYFPIIQTNDEPYPYQDRTVAEALIHEHYKRGSHFNDIALLVLDQPVELAENVNTACLPPQDYRFDHQRCFATGWVLLLLHYFNINFYYF